MGFAGSGLCKLVEWLRRGGIDREAALLRVLAKAPLPKVYVPQKLKRPGPGRPLLLPHIPVTLMVRGTLPATKLIPQRTQEALAALGCFSSPDINCALLLLLSPCDGIV